MGVKMKFLTRKRDKQDFPTDNSTPKKEYRRHYDSNPSFSTKRQVHSDIKQMHRGDDPLEPQEHGKEFDVYKRKLQYESDKQYLKEKKKQSKKQKRAIKKEEKMMAKQRAQDEEQCEREDEEVREIVYQESRV